MPAVLIGCGDPPPAYDSPEQIIAEAQADVANKMKDPASAQFRGLRIVRGYAVCGEINAKNSFGAYAGYEPFVFINSGTAPAGVTLNDWGVHLLSSPKPKLLREEGEGYQVMDPWEMIQRHCR